MFGGQSQDWTEGLTSTHAGCSNRQSGDGLQETGARVRRILGLIGSGHVLLDAIGGTEHSELFLEFVPGCELKFESTQCSAN